MLKSLVIVAVLTLGLSGIAVAQDTNGHDPVADALIGPDVVMANQQALGLTDAQRSAIQTDVETAQQRFTHLQWQLASAGEKLVDLLKATHVDREKAIAALDAELALERQVKETQMTLMIAVKNALTAEQQAVARRLAAANRK
jgi:Spy/CpxP family protein refolding chaperone